MNLQVVFITGNWIIFGLWIKQDIWGHLVLWETLIDMLHPLWHFIYQTTNQIIKKIIAVAILLIIINVVLNITGCLLCLIVPRFDAHTQIWISQGFFLPQETTQMLTFIFKYWHLLKSVFFHYLGSLQQDGAGKWIRNLDYNQVMDSFGQRQWGKNTWYKVR